MTKETKNKAGRPAKNIIPPINDMAQNAAKAIMKQKPKKKWDYLNKE